MIALGLSSPIEVADGLKGALPLWEQHLTLTYVGKTQDLPDPILGKCRDAASRGAASAPSIEALVSGAAVLG